MGMFDEVRAINISHKNFVQGHNDTTFQTKDMENTMSVYSVFNGQLYQDVDSSRGYQRHEYAMPVAYNGELNIYTSVIKEGVESWVEYDLHFDSGKLIDVTPYESRVTKDHRDLSSQRPGIPSNRITVTISLSDCDKEKKHSFVSTLAESKIDAIRDLLGEPTATVVYPVLHTGPINPLFNGGSEIRMVTSAVQTKDDFISACKSQAKLKAPNGDEIKIFLDEGSIFHRDIPK